MLPPPQTSPSAPLAHKPDLFDLPSELREQIYDLALAQTTYPIVLIPNHGRFANELPAAEPALSKVNRQLRAEVLAIFYRSNTFAMGLGNPAGLASSAAWLYHIGDVNVGWLQRLSFSGFVMVPFGHMASRRWVRLLLQLRDGGVVVERGVQGGELVEDAIERFRGAVRRAFEAKGRSKWDVEGVAMLMNEFGEMCSLHC